ncbi:hypothetical protein ONA70_36125, partial [Micromonospora yasonensis]|uniref:hypothetical protein n=1 Tax=Micromonospora yasonensis TaxID=1128667 RepID=UPI00222E7614
VDSSGYLTSRDGEVTKGRRTVVQDRPSLIFDEDSSWFRSIDSIARTAALAAVRAMLIGHTPIAR